MVNKGRPFYGYARVKTVGISAIAVAATTTEVAVFAAPFRCKIMKCSIIANTTLTGQDTHYQTLGFKNKGSAGAGTSVIASKAFTNAVNATALAETNIGTVSNNLLREGDTITFYKAVTGNGHATPALIAKVEYVKV